MRLGRITVREIAVDPRKYVEIAKDYEIDIRTVSRIKLKHVYAEFTIGIPADPRVVGNTPAYSLEVAKKVYLDKRPYGELMLDYKLSIWQVINIKQKRVSSYFYELVALDEGGLK